MTQSLTLDSISAHYGSTQVLENFSLAVAEGELVSLLGASGCGKTTTLRLVAGFLQPTSGTITLGGRDLTRLPPHQRDIGLVFQNYALFPHLSVADNVGFGLKQRGISGNAKTKRVGAMLDRVGLAHLADRLPAALSGGQKQRVAIARALAMEPELLLFDEPTSALDPELVSEVLRVIRTLADEGTTMLLVTHELGFAYHCANRVLFIADGVIHESGTPAEVLKNPQEARTRSFLSRHNEFNF